MKKMFLNYMKGFFVVLGCVMWIWLVSICFNALSSSNSVYVMFGVGGLLVLVYTAVFTVFTLKNILYKISS